MRRLLFSVLSVCCLAGLAIADGIKSYRIGDMRFVALKDKDTNMGKAILLQPDAQVVKDVMADDQNPSSINAFFVLIPDKKATKKVLIDTGLGSSGELLSSLQGANIMPEDVNIILLTHMHGDHIGGLLDAEGGRVFKKAVLYVHEKELEYWLNNESASKTNAELAKAVKEAYGADVKTFKWGANILPQIKSVNAAGHTPGHTAFELTSKNDKVLVVGDVIHSFQVQLADPNMSVTFDVDPKAAAKSRIRVFDYAAKNNIKIAGMHIPFSGVGYISKGEGISYKFEAVE
jgi:glyoxylase-like metal-dependent hydrolase (beta-lactamase superfamily II)